MGLLTITTGGTIGALAYPDPRHPPQFSSFPADGDAVRKRLQGQDEIRFVSLEPHDSKDIDTPYLHSITRIIESAPETEILITHGTDRILESADFFYRHTAANDGFDGKLILLTGAMIPLANGPESDGHANLVFALEQLTALTTELPPARRTPDNSIYIVLHDCHQPHSQWKPRLYRFEPGRYAKHYDTDGRYNRITDQNREVLAGIHPNNNPARRARKIEMSLSA